MEESQNLVIPIIIQLGPFCYYLVGAVGHEHPSSPLSGARQKQLEDHWLKRPSFGLSTRVSLDPYLRCRQSTSWRWRVRGSWRRGGGRSGWDRWCCCWRARRSPPPCRGLWRGRPPGSAHTGPGDLRTDKDARGQGAEKRNRAAGEIVRASSGWPLEMDELLGLAMKQVRQTWMEQRKPRFTGAVGAKLAMHSPW